MARGKRTSDEDVYKVMSAWAAEHNYSEVSRRVGMPRATVRRIVERYASDPQFRQLQENVSVDFAERATRLIDKGITLLERRFDRALDYENQIDMLIDMVGAVKKEELNDAEKNKMINTLIGLKLQDIKAITTAIGTLYDKRALARGESSGSVDVQIKLPDDAGRFAG